MLAIWLSLYRVKCDPDVLFSNYQLYELGILSDIYHDKVSVGYKLYTKIYVSSRQIWRLSNTELAKKEATYVISS